MLNLSPPPPPLMPVKFEPSPWKNKAWTLSNLYEDIAEDILNNLVFDSSNVDYVNQLLFVSMIENAISYLADDVFDSFNKSETDAVNIMLKVHNKGAGVCGIFPKDIAETKDFTL